jgi:3',5'-nucleoside bisphosphate phosphatase
LIDLHMHTTASDGRSTPEELVRQAFAAGIRTMSVTDHDTMAAIDPVTRAAEALGMTVVPGIEITSVHDGKDVHVLAYYLSASAPGLQDMLTRQRRLRVERAVEIGERLARMGAPIDVQALVDTASAPGGKALARPQIAQALITAGHVATVAEAFERFLSEESPAYVPHRGASPIDVVELVESGGGIASLAHPGYRPKDEIIPAMVEAGMEAIEVFHSSHDETAQVHYLAIAMRHGLLVTGGSDFHGVGTRRSEFFGVTNLPREHYEKLSARADAKATTRA